MKHWPYKMVTVLMWSVSLPLGKLWSCQFQGPQKGDCWHHTFPVFLPLLSVTVLYVETEGKSGKLAADGLWGW